MNELNEDASVYLVKKMLKCSVLQPFHYNSESYKHIIRDNVVF